MDGQDVEIESSSLDAFTSILETLPTQIDMSERATGENDAPGSGKGKATGNERRYRHMDGHDVKGLDVAEAADKYFEEHQAEGISYSDAIVAVSEGVS